MIPIEEMTLSDPSETLSYRMSGESRLVKRGPSYLMAQSGT